MNAVAQAVAQPLRNWSPYQQAIYAFAEQPQRPKRLVIKAGAGSGKSTTGVELVKRVTGSHIFLAFNKPIQLELEARGVNAKTFHGLCFRPVLKARRVVGVDKDKVNNFVRDNFDETPEQLSYYGAFVTKLVGLAKNMGIGCLLDDTEANWDALADRHDLELEHEQADWAEAIRLSRRVLAWSNRADSVDFNDLLYFAVKDGITLPKYDNVIVDEGQDTNAIQIAVIRKLLHATSDLYVVGDDSQAIYGFRGADSDALDNIVKAFDTARLPLTISYRCGTKIVDYAKQFGEIEAAPGAIEGVVRTAQLKDLIPELKAGDLIISRCTKPLIEAAYNLLRARKPAYVMGREIGQGLKSLINKMNAKGVDRLIEKLNEFTAREVEKARAKDQESKAEAIQDKTDCVLFLIETLPETGRTVPALLKVIDDLFADKANAITLATVHRSKGLEAAKVLWLNYDYINKWARQDWQKQQEKNLCYVAATRAKSELVLIPSPKKTA